MKVVVLHLLVSNKFSGAENVVCQIINAFKDAKDVEMIYCSVDGPIRDSLKEKGVPFVPIKKASLMEVKRVVKETCPSIIHAHDMRASFLASMAASKTPLISHIHNNNFDSRGLSIKSYLYRFAAKKARHIFWVSDNSFNGYFFHNEFVEKSSILYNVIDINLIEQKVLQDAHSYDYDIIYLGRLSYPKDPIRLLNVFVEVVKRIPDVKIAVVGEGDMKEQFVRNISEKNLGRNIDFMGYKDNPYKVLSCSKVMIMTSLWEGLPMCALEAMSLGVPLVSTPVGGLKEIIVNEENGILSNENNVLADSICKIISNPDYRQYISNNAKMRMKQLMDINKFRDTIEQVYNKCK